MEINERIQQYGRVSILKAVKAETAAEAYRALG